MKNLLMIRKRRRWIGLLVGAYLVYPLAMMMSTMLQGSIFAQLLQALLMIVGVLVVLWITQGKITRQHLSLQTTNVRQTIVWSVIGFVILQLLVLIREKRVPGAYTSVVDQFQALGLGTSVTRDMLTLLTIGLLVPIAEELIFRGVLFRVIRDRLDQTGKIGGWVAAIIAAVVASALFMEVHLSDGITLASLIYVLMSMIFIVVYVQTGSLRTAMMVHILNNTFVLGQIIFSSSTGSLTQPWTVYLLVLLPVIGWILCDKIDRVLPNE